MTFLELLPYFNNEEKAEEYLREAGILKKIETCIYCNSGSLGKIRRGKIKCYNCKREWNRRKGSIIENNKISYTKYLLYLKLFSLNYLQIELASELNISRIKIRKMSNEIRILILHSYLKSFRTFKQKENADFNSNIFLKFSESNIHAEFFDKPLEKIGLTNGLLVTLKRNKNLSGEYFYSFQTNYIGNPTTTKFNLLRNWGTLKNYLIKFTGRSKTEMYLYLFECVFRINHSGKIFKEICNIFKVADNYH